MGVIEESVDVAVPVRAAYNQWTQFESFPRFMPGVKHVHQWSPAMVHWVTRFGPVTREFDTEIVEQSPDESVSWRSMSRPLHTGTVSFRSTAPDRTRLTLQVQYTPRGLVERTADTLGVVRGRIRGELAHFKQFIERRGEETGAWRGTIRGGHVRPQEHEADGNERSQPRVPCWPTG